jgi:hypothetical protein
VPCVSAIRNGGYESRSAALEAIGARHSGEPVDSPKLIEPQTRKNSTGTDLRSAYDGWAKMENRPVSTTLEFSRAIERFIELHGNLGVASINRKHVREFREAAQQVPKHRSGKLKGATLRELVEWSRKRPERERVAASSLKDAPK